MWKNLREDRKAISSGLTSVLVALAEQMLNNPLPSSSYQWMQLSWTLAGVFIISVLVTFGIVNKTRNGYYVPNDTSSGIVSTTENNTRNGYYVPNDTSSGTVSTTGNNARNGYDVPNDTSSGTVSTTGNNYNPS